MKPRPSLRCWSSHGDGNVTPHDFGEFGKNIIIEKQVLFFHPASIIIGDNVYIGHNAILHGYHTNKMIIGKGTWIGPMCYFHSAGGITIGTQVGIGPGVKIITSQHEINNQNIPIIHNKITFNPVVIEDGCDIGIGAIILPGVTIGKGAQIGAGAVVTDTIPSFAVAVGIPAKVIKLRR